jgi:hypothetical protein
MFMLIQVVVRAGVMQSQGEKFRERPDAGVIVEHSRAGDYFVSSNEWLLKRWEMS